MEDGIAFERLKRMLDSKAEQYNHPDFIATDPVSIPHLFSKKQDVEIMGLFAAILAWGQRITTIKNCKFLADGMDNDPIGFILNHSDRELLQFENFCHRTFKYTDLAYFCRFLQSHYRENDSLETAFSNFLSETDTHVGPAIVGFHNLFFSLPNYPIRTLKHISTPLKNSACKRLNLYLRWMVRKDNNGFDFGIWNKIKPSQLVCPLDTHTLRVGFKLSLTDNEKMNWKTALLLTENLRKFDPIDPVKYDFALFGLGIEGTY